MKHLNQKTVTKVFYGFLLFICFLTNTTYSQVCLPVFKKLYGGSGNDEAKDILYTTDRGSIIVGQTTSNTSGDYDAFVLKLDEQGMIMWSKQFGGIANDQLIRIKSTLDGGYIAIGNSRSYGTGNKEVILAKLDLNGNLSWTRHFGKNSADITAKEIIQLSDGNYVFIANENDSTAQSNGIVCKLDVAGNILWTKTFDHGNDDGFNYVTEDGANLYITGYASIDLRDAILIQLDKLNGNVQYSKKFIIEAGRIDEVLNIYKIPNGIAFGVKSLDPFNTNANLRLTLFKMRNNGSVFYERKIGVGGVDVNDWVNVVTTNDSGFAFVAYDKSITGYSIVNYLGPTGISEWKRNLYEFFETTRINAIDKNGTDGFLYAGFMNSAITGLKNKITVYKANINGNVGTCTEGDSWISDTSKYFIENFSWNSISIVNNFSNSLITPVMSNTGFTIAVRCENIECTNAPPIPPGCNSTFLMKYKSDRSLRSWDITATNDGGHAIVGSYYDYTEEPFINKLSPNGDVQWSRRLSQFGHTGFFTKVLTATDGNLIIFGHDNYTANNGSTNSSILLKVNSNTGQVIWSKYFADHAGDIAHTDDGGYVLVINEHWGGGSPNPYVVRLDANCNIIWQRQLYSLGGGPSFRSIIFEAPYIYLAADMYGSNPTIPNPPNSVQIIKLEAATGNKVWIKQYSVNGESTNLQTINKIADTLFVGISMPQDPDKMYHGMICLNLNGDEIRSFKLTQPHLSNYAYTFFGTSGPFRPYNLMKTSDNNFIVADQTITPTLNSVSLTKYNTRGQILWSRNYPTLSDHIVTAIKEMNGSLLISGTRFLGLVNNMQKRDLYLLKTDLNGKVSDASSGQCFSEPWVATSIPVSISSIYAGGDSIRNTNFVSIQNYTTYDRPITIWAELSCSVPSICNLVEILGTSATCSLSDTFNYTIQRNPGCQSPVTWQTDQLTTNTIAFTDSTLRVNYIKNGQTFIIAHLTTGCGDFADTLFMNVMRNASSLNLGPDTTICERNTIVLNAGSGFQTYLWQDGSTADSLIINSPGLYFVLVTDSCGNNSRDSIIVTPHAPIAISVGSDRQKCNNDTLQITASSGFLNYSWSPNYNINSLTSQSVIVNPSVDTSYFVAAEKTTGCFAFDTVNIKVNHSATINLGNDTSICTGQSLILNAGSGFISYLWNNGNITSQITVNATGFYSVTATDFQGCKSKDTLTILNVFALPLVILDHNTELCTGTIKTLDAGSFTNYLWQDGSTTRTFLVQGIGTYYVSVTDINGCKGSDTTKINTILPLPYDFLPLDTTICNKETITLQALQNFSSYLWSTNNTSPYINITQPGTYWLQVRDNKNCIGRDSITIQIKQCFKGIYVPNSFTPNGDTKNDKLRALVFGNLVKFEFSIYNRYGQLVFQSKDINEGWDGTIRGVKQNPGTYVWVCRYEFIERFENIETGTSILIR
ncbi:MAG: gliding motility-associated C-terminal domain-containing protein [Ferruginibacter sp.]